MRTRAMKKNRKNKAGKSQRPAHHMFGNAVLNELFCPSPSAARAYVDASVETFDEWFHTPEIPDECREARITAYIMGVMETAFELGWREAMKREAIPQVKLIKNRMDAHIAHLELDCKYAGNPWEDEL